jgi:hypothetical protein
MILVNEKINILEKLLPDSANGLLPDSANGISRASVISTYAMDHLSIQKQKALMEEAFQ